MQRPQHAVNISSNQRTSGNASSAPTNRIDLTKHLKIWFSTNPDVPLTLINELRLICHHINNPTHELHLLVAKHKLTANSVEKLEQFCKKYRIILHDVNEIGATLTSTVDKVLLQHAMTELNDPDGNMAAASDIFRWLAADLKCVYSDLDWEINFGNITTIDAGDSKIGGFLIPFTMNKNKIDKFANSFIAVSDPNHPLVLKMKQLILSRYTAPILNVLNRRYDSVIEARNSYPELAKREYPDDEKEAAEFAENCYRADISSRSGCIQAALTQLYLTAWKENKANWENVSFYKTSLKQKTDYRFDLSWMPSGHTQLINNEQRILQAAITLQGFFKNLHQQKQIASNDNAKEKNNTSCTPSQKT